eukprot:GFYU01008260.1.p1 GENE.GFYU01008260.1~~GFYU01008260.1.p1  ORF type:complete len:280 (-),score=72.42 GFYU01008260.1:98-880(-)
MYPGKRSCPSGWTRKYEGYLMGAHYTHKKLDWVCVDVAPNKIGSSGNQDGALLYPTEAEHFPGYSHNYEISCAMCTTPKMGAIFTRWGHRSCPDGSTRVYHGMMGGAHASHSGSGTNYQCMPPSPETNGGNSGNQNGALMYRVEYVVNGYGIGTMTHLDHYEAGCSVCQADGAQATFMVPGTTECPSGHRREYYGALFSAYYSHQGKGQFVCIDHEAEKLGSSHHTNHARIYPVESEMRNGRGASWNQNHEVACAVCSRI